MKALEELFHEKAIDHTVLYTKANELGSELFRDFTLEDRKQKFESEVSVFIMFNIQISILFHLKISRLQQDIDLQGQIRDEMIIEYNNALTDDNTKRKIQARLENLEEKVQALRKFLTSYYQQKTRIHFFSGALTIFYCSGEHINTFFL
jgi:uncharacterized protein YlxW (UPF0749 family)